MRDVYREGRFETDSWIRVEDGGELPREGAVFVSLRRWQDERAVLSERGGPLGLILRAGEGVESIVGDLAEFASIAVEFPKFSDGRSFSTARILHEQLKFDGEIRAFGDVLLDQIPFMRRCGVSAFEISHDPTRRALEDGQNPEVVLHTQPGAVVGEAPTGSRPWLRKGAENSTLEPFVR